MSRELGVPAALRHLSTPAKKGGIQAQVKLAMITKMSSTQAEAAEDSPENIKMFEDAMGQL